MEKIKICVKTLWDQILRFLQIYWLVSWIFNDLVQQFQWSRKKVLNPTPKQYKREWSVKINTSHKRNTGPVPIMTLWPFTFFSYKKFMKFGNWDHEARLDHIGSYWLPFESYTSGRFDSPFRFCTCLNLYSTFLLTNDGIVLLPRRSGRNWIPRRIIPSSYNRLLCFLCEKPITLLPSIFYISPLWVHCRRS